MKAHDYAQAILEASNGAHKDANAFLESIITHLKQTGRSKMLPAILREVKQQSSQKTSTDTVLEVASKEETASAKKALEAEGIAPKHTHVNPDLIRGWRVRTKDTLIDRSGKKALIDLYRNITRA